MALADVLEKVGEGAEKALKTTGRVAGAALPAVGKSIANEEAGYAPQIAAEGRAQKQKMDDAQLAAKEQELTTQLETGRKYGTLTPEQQAQYVDQITQLYSHPRHAGTLMEKLRQAVHPNGAIAGAGVVPNLKNAVPPGGTAAADEQAKERAQDAKDQAALELATRKAELAAKYRKPGGKSPALTGSQLPPDAVGVDGQPIPPEQRTAMHSFVEYGGQWWPTQAKPPILTSIKGHRVLLDANTRLPIKDLGPVSGVKVTDGGHWAPNGDPVNPQMVWMPSHSVSGPGGEAIEVQVAPDVEQEGGTPSPASPAAPTATSKAATPAKPKANVGSILKSSTTGARPVAAGGPLRTLPGGSAMARSKDMLYKSDVTQYTKMAEDMNVKKQAYQSADKALREGSTASSDQELIYAWVRSNVQGAGRMTQAEFQQAASVGSLPLRAQSAWEKLKSGKLSPEVEKMMFADIKRSYEISKQEADDLRKKIEGGAGSPGVNPSSDDPLGLFK